MSVSITVGLFMALLFRRDVPCDLLFLGGLILVVVLGIITPEQALAGFANSGVITVGALFIVAAGLRKTGVLDFIGNLLLGPVQHGQCGPGSAGLQHRPDLGLHQQHARRGHVRAGSAGLVPQAGRLRLRGC